MSGLRYHRVEPTQKKDFYTEFDTLDMNIAVDMDRVLVKNSCRLVYDLRIKDNNARPTDANRIYYDNRAGGHAFIDSVQVEFDMMGQKENIQNYSRSVVMEDVALKCPEDNLNASAVCEIKGYDEDTSHLYSKGRVTRNSGAKLPADFDGRGDVNVALLVNCCLNKMSGGDLPASKTGMIKLSINLAPNSSALMGASLNNAEDSYEIRNPRLLYRTLPDNGGNSQTIMRTMYNTKNSFQSNFASLNVKAPVKATGVSISFQRQDQEQVAPFSNYKMAKPRNISRIEFNFNNAVERISYPIEDLNEMRQRFVDSYLDTGHNSTGGDRRNDNSNFGVGISFGGIVDLSNQSFGVQITSGADNQNPYNIYQYFHGVIVV
tara:strand:- start:914 stop:2041 length:1128 start_codon:yes stop_codon:yes gene_type:complete